MLYSQYAFVGVPLHTARIACWFSRATTHWSNFCTRDGVDSQTVLRMIRESKITGGQRAVTLCAGVLAGIFLGYQIPPKWYILGFGAQTNILTPLSLYPSSPRVSNISNCSLFSLFCKLIVFLFKSTDGSEIETVCELKKNPVSAFS